MGWDQHAHFLSHPNLNDTLVFVLDLFKCSDYFHLDPSHPPTDSQARSDIHSPRERHFLSPGQKWKYIFKPYRPEDENEDRFEYVPQNELEAYERLEHLQRKYIPICYGLIHGSDKTRRFDTIWGAIQNLLCAEAISAAQNLAKTTREPPITIQQPPTA